MSRYDYACTKCGREFEVTHSMNETPSVPCEDCGSPSKKLISACGIIVRNSSARRRVMDHTRRANDARQDLSENFGVESITPVGGSSMSDVYNDVKRRGSEVREKMQRKREETENERVQKAKMWKKTAMKRAPERTKILVEKREQERAAKRKIAIKR